MAPKKKTSQEDLIPVEDGAVFQAEEESVASSVSVDDMSELDIPDEDSSEMEAMVIAASDNPGKTPAPVNTQTAFKTTGNRMASGVEREALAAERSEQWDIEQEDITTVGIFLTALKEKRILEGTVAGVEANSRTAYWVIYEGPVTVRIHFDNSFMSIPADLAKRRPAEDVLRRQRQMLDRAMGAKINFTISSLIKDANGGYLAAGSRTDALSKIRKVYFGARASQPLEKGKDVMAQVLTNGEHAAYITFCGIDIKVRKSDLSHKFIQDVTSSFYVGKMIRVRILNIEPAVEPNGIPTVSVSAKPVEKDKFKRNLSRVRRHGTYIGTVISSTKRETPEGSVVTITLFLDNVDVPAFSSTTIMELGETLKQGDKVSFEAMGVNEEGFAHGKIREVIKPRN